MSQHVNWKRTAVIWVTFVAAAVAYSLTPETWSFFVAAAIVLFGWFLWEAMPKTIGGEEVGDASQASAGAGTGETPAQDGWSAFFSILTGSLFFGLLAALVLPGIGNTFGLPATPVYAMGVVLAFGFGIWAYRSQGLWGALVATVAFLAPVLLLVYHWYRVP